MTFLIHFIYEKGKTILLKAADEQEENETEDEQGKSEDQQHESTFIKQLIYFLLMTTMNAG